MTSPMKFSGIRTSTSIIGSRRHGCAPLKASLKAQIPQSELYHYSTTIRSLTGGRGIHSESFNHYEYLPQELQKRFIAKSHSDNNED